MIHVYASAAYLLLSERGGRSPSMCRGTPAAGHAAASLESVQQPNTHARTHARTQRGAAQMRRMARQLISTEHFKELVHTQTRRCVKLD